MLDVCDWVDGLWARPAKPDRGVLAPHPVSRCSSGVSGMLVARIVHQGQFGEMERSHWLGEDVLVEGMSAPVHIGDG